MSATLTSEQLLATLNWRYATQKFDSTKKIDPATWAALEQSLVLAPSSFGAQPWKFLIVESPAIRERLMAASWGQRQVMDASHLVVFTFRKDLDAAHLDRHVARVADVRGVELETLEKYRSGLHKAIEGARAAGSLDAWQARQVYIALGQFMTSAAILGVDTCPMEGLSPAKYDEILGLTGTGFTTLCACPAGYRADDDKYAATPKVRFPAADVITRI
ncbi:MAG: NAD(P)H-dependent oxidoreductase [Rariglobus sp.]